MKKLEKINYSHKDLSPVMSEQTLNYHRGKLAKGYVDNYNKGIGDKDFNEAGAFLHNLFFPQLKKPSGSNKPNGKILDLINEKYENYKEFQNSVEEVAKSIQGSGWIYINSNCEIKTIKNHQIKKDIVILIDWWEHAWSLDYQHDKMKYLKNIWKIINWDIINARLSNKTKRASAMNEIRKKYLKSY